MNEFDSPLSEKKVRVIIFFTPNFDDYFHLTYKDNKNGQLSLHFAITENLSWLQKRSGCQKTTSHNTVFTLKNRYWYLEATSCKPNWNILQFFYNINKINDHYARNMICGSGKEIKSKKYIFDKNKSLLSLQ